MDNRYLFRGKRIDNGEWVEGCLWMFSDVSKPRIVIDQGDVYVIDPATTGQCTGLKDKNGIYIYDGDIIRRFDVEYSVIGFSLNNQSRMCFRDASMDLPRHDFDFHIAAHCEVVGNIYENPELLGGKE